MKWRCPINLRETAARRRLNNREPRIAEDRVATFGSAFEPVQVAAPKTFTMQVMARIESQPAPPLLMSAAPAWRGLREGLLVVLMTLVFSALLVLASAGVLALFAPTTALALLGALVGGIVALLSLLRTIAVWMTSATANEVIIAALAFMTGLAVLIRFGIVRSNTHAPREA